MSKLNKILNDKSNKMKKTDWIIAIILCLIFGIFAFYKLGSNINPETYAYFNNNDTVNFELNKVTYVSKMRYFMGSDIGDYSIYYSIDGDDYFYLTGIKREYEFKWYDIYIGSDVKYLKIVSDSDNCYLGEIMLYDKDNNKISISSNDNGKKLIDESYTIPDEISYFNSTYFDEIYFARAAYDYVVGLPASEWTHPPFAKLIQAIPIYLLGMNPFSYRLIGVICGMLLVLVMYYFAKLMFKNRIYAVFAGLLIVFDNFHLVQSRIGTSDSELILFMVLSSLFMYKYLLLNKKDDFHLKVFYLSLSGLFFGLSICVKWTGFYLGLGICILFFIKLIKEIISDKKISKDNIKIILSCILFYILIPCSIYILCYFMFPNLELRTINNMSDLFAQLKDMYQFHSTLDASHPFSSKWYTWPIMYKPLWYDVNIFENGLKSTIVAIGNPSIWWFGIAGFIYVVIDYIKNKKYNNLFLIIMILCLFLPYAFIGRVMFIYHYYPVIPFLILGITMFIKYINEKVGRTWIMYAYLGVVIVLFFMFYPVTTGIPVSNEYIESLKWFSSWIF